MITDAWTKSEESVATTIHPSTNENVAIHILLQQAILKATSPHL